jgi:adenosine deaminase
MRSISTDDPTLHLVTPTRSWGMTLEHFGFGLDDLAGFLRNGLDGAWIDSTTRARWQLEWAAEFDALRARLRPGRDPKPEA